MNQIIRTKHSNSEYQYSKYKPGDVFEVINDFGEYYTARIISGSEPDSICAVVKQGLRHENGFPKRNKCQFSWFCHGQPDIIRNVHEWRDAYRLASYVSTGRDHLVDITDGSLWYHADYVQPKWAKHKRKTAKIDTHIFYR